MARKKTYQEDSDDDEDDDLMPGMTIKGEHGQRTYEVQSGVYARHPPPTKLWPYSYITKEWAAKLIARGIGDKRVKSFLSLENLANGSPNGGSDSHWSHGQEFWQAEVSATGHTSMFFSGHAIDELCNMLAEQCPQMLKSDIKPVADRGLDVRKTEPGSLTVLKRMDVASLRSLVDTSQVQTFNFELAQNRLFWEKIRSEGGAALAVKTQLFETDARIVLDIGWSGWRFMRDKQGQILEQDLSEHYIVKESLGYRNGIQLPDNREKFGFGTSVTLSQSEIWQRLAVIVGDMAKFCPMLILLHDAEPEIAHMVKHRLDIRLWRTSFPQNLYEISPTTKQYPVIIQDTQRLYAAYSADPHEAQITLSRACEQEAIRVQKMYNAGNDSYFMLQLFDKLMSARKNGRAD